VDSLESLLLHPSRHLLWPGTFNVRDVGGYPTADGRRTRWQTLLRGDGYYCRRERADLEALHTGISTVVDLRSESELRERPSPFRSSRRPRYVNAPLFDEDARPAADGSASQYEAYRFVIDHRSGDLVRILGLLAEPGALPALVHCHAGKDRTGIVVALLLALVGVPRRIIAEDYGLSARYLTEAYIDEAITRAAARGLSHEEWAERFPCPPLLMVSLLDHVDTTYGGVGAYLLAAGLAPEQMRSLRAALAA
jgi:protein-tyrosine phosphatase